MSNTIDGAQTSKGQRFRGIATFDNHTTIVETPNIVITPSISRKRSIDQVYDSDSSESTGRT